MRCSGILSPYTLVNLDTSQVIQNAYGDYKVMWASVFLLLLFFSNLSDQGWLIIWKTYGLWPIKLMEIVFLFSYLFCLFLASFWMFLRVTERDLFLIPSPGIKGVFGGRSILLSKACMLLFVTGILKTTGLEIFQSSLENGAWFWRLMARFCYQVWNKSEVIPLNAGPLLQHNQEQNATLSLIPEMASGFIGAMHLCRTFPAFAAAAAWCKSDFLAAGKSADYIWSSNNVCWSFVFLGPA